MNVASPHSAITSAHCLVGVGYTDTFEDDPGMVFYVPGTTGWTDSFGGLPTAQWTPTGPLISSTSVAVQGNQFGFTIVWATNLPVVVEACTNLANPAWQPVQTNSLSNGACDFTDPQGAIYPARYFRVRSP